jgi:hypothetical protein
MASMFCLFVQRQEVDPSCSGRLRRAMVHKLKGLDDAICFTMVHSTWQRARPDHDEHKGWVFWDHEGNTKTYEGNDPDPCRRAALNSPNELY